MSAIDKRVNVIESKIDALPDMLIKRLDDRYVTKNQWWHILAAIGLLVIGGLADRLWSFIVAAAAR